MIVRKIRRGHRRNRVVAAGVLAATTAATSAHAGGLFLYEMGDTRSWHRAAGRAAAADNAATAFGNPAGMTRLDQSQMLVGIQPAYGISHFDKGDDTTVARWQRRQCLRLHSGAGRLLRLQRHARSQVRHLAGVGLRTFGTVREHLVRPVLRHEVGADHPRRLSGRRLPGEQTGSGSAAARRSSTAGSTARPRYATSSAARTGSSR